MSITPNGHSEHVLVWTARGQDAEMTLRILASGGFRALRCANLAELEAGLAEGAGCAVITQEVLDAEARTALSRQLAAQPPWSDLPLIVFTAVRGHVLHDLGNVTSLDRPVRAETLLGAVRAALRARRRQYQGEEAIRLRDQFLAMLGHELRNPLGAIVLAVDVMARVAGDVGAKQRQMIERQARHLAQLVDDLLDVSRVTSGKVALKRAPLDLHEVLRRCLQSVEAGARAKSIHIGLMPTRAPITVDGDGVRLEQIFNNLLINAIKYSPVGSSVDVTACVNDGFAVTNVTDTGMGIDPALLTRVFDMFVQAQTSLDRSQGGMGIGLTLVKTLVELHGGTVTARSEGKDRGSQFIVRLPLASRAADSAAAAALPALPRLPLRIVLIEDNPDIRESLRDYLVPLGYEVHAACDGPSGLVAILDHRPDIALVDIGLPLMDGYAVARQVRETLGHDIRLVAMTGYGQAEDRQRAREAGFDDHLTKPVMLTVLDQLLAGVPGAPSAA